MEKPYSPCCSKLKKFLSVTEELSNEICDLSMFIALIRTLVDIALRDGDSEFIKLCTKDIGKHVENRGVKDESNEMPDGDKKSPSTLRSSELEDLNP